MALQHLRSGTAHKRPVAANLSDGQLAVNTHADSPGLFFKAANGTLIKLGPAHVGTTAPNGSPAGSSGNSIGEAWLDTSGANPLLKVWSGSAWLTTAGIGAATPVTTADTGTVTSTMIANGTIVNADISGSAAIDGTKISPNFGSQAVTTSGAGSFGGVALTAGVYKQAVVAVSALAIDCSAGNYFTKTISADSTFTVSNVPTSCVYSFVLELTHTSGNVTWFSGVEWPSGTAPILTTGKTHLFIFVTDDGGTRWRGSSAVSYTN